MIEAIRQGLLWALSKFPSPEQDGKGLICTCCNAPIKRHDRYTITGAQHKNCYDPKLVGQLSIEESYDEL